MIHEFAVDPALLCNFERFRYLAEKFGFEQGRLISRYPKRWAKIVYEGLDESVTDVQRKKIEVLLDKIKQEKLIKGRINWQESLDWLQNAENEHMRHAFHAILAVNNPRSHEVVLPYEDLTEDTPRWATQPQRVVQRQAMVMANTLTPIFRIAKQLVFIDPYFDPCKAGSMRSLKAYLQQCWTISPYPKIEFHTRFNPGNKLFQTKCKDLEACIPIGRNITIICWDRQNAIMHNRYVLTDRGGVSFGWGLDAGESSQTDDATLLARDVYEARWEQYVGNPTLTKELCFTVEGQKSQP